MDDFHARACSILVTAGGALTMEQARQIAIKQMAEEAERDYTMRGRRALIAPIFALVVAFAGCVAQIMSGVPS